MSSKVASRSRRGESGFPSYRNVSTNEGDLLDDLETCSPSN